MRPYITVHMLTSLDGRNDLARWTASPDGKNEDWQGLYMEKLEPFNADGYLIGRTTMAEMLGEQDAKPSDGRKAQRPYYFARKDADRHVFVLDRSSKLRFASGDFMGDPLVVLVGKDVSDDHLAELATNGVSYIVAETDDFDVAALLKTIRAELGTERLMCMGGGIINGSLLEAGVIDEISLLVLPVLDGRKSGGIFDAEGLKDRVQLSFLSADLAKNGAVHMRYKVVGQ